MFLPEVPAHQGCVFVKIEQDPREPWRGSQATWQIVPHFPTAGRNATDPQAEAPWEPPGPSLFHTELGLPFTDDWQPSTLSKYP